MTLRERFQNIMNFQPCAPMPCLEWICWWEKTIDRWLTEGLPRGMNREDTLRWFALDVHEWVWLSPRFQIPRPPGRIRSQGLIDQEADYDRLVLPALANPRVDRSHLEKIAARQRCGEVVVWLQFDGFFWYPREIFGVEPHLFAFFDQPKLMHRMNQDLCHYNLELLRQVLEIFTPDVMTFAEDLSYNHGPMLSQDQFEEFIAPYYRQIIPLAKSHGVIPMIDTDGDVTTVIPWLEAAGIEGCLPLERMAGVDVAAIRRNHPRWRMIGGFDKTIMHLGESAIRAEFDRLLPVMRTGGFIPTTDHQTPPEVSLENFHTYIKVLKEYANRIV